MVSSFQHSLVLAIGCLGMMLFGYDTGVVSGALLLIRATSYEGGQSRGV